MADLTPDQILDLAKQYESKGQNVRNYRYDPGHTAQGYYQITNENWKNYGPKVGVDLSQYPNAMAAPEDVQRKVAHHLLTQTPKGALNWESPEFRRAIGAKEEPVAQEQQNYGDMSDEELRKLVMKDPELSKRIITTPPSGPGDKPKTLRVQEPEAGWHKFLRQWGESKTPEDFMHGGMIIPGLKQMARGATEPGGDWRSHTADIIEGGGRAAAPVGIGALLGLTGGAGASALLEGEGLTGALGAGFRASIPFMKGAAGGTLGYGAGQLASQDPETRRVASDILGLAGSAYGPRVSLPKGRVAPAVIRGLGNILPIPGAKHLGDFAADWMLGKGAPEPPIKAPPAKAAPKGEVKPPKPPSPAQSADALRTGVIDENRFLEHEAMRGHDPQTAKENLATVKAKIAEEAPPPPQPTATVIPEEKMPPQMMTSGTPTEVNLPPNLKIKTTAPVPGPTPQGTGMPPSPTQPPAPGSLGTVGPLPPSPQGPPLAGPAAGGTPISPPLGQPPIPPEAPQNLGTVGPLPPSQPGPPLEGPAATGTPTPPPLGQVMPPAGNIPPSPGLGPVAPMGPRPSITGPIPKSTPLGTMPPTPVEARGIKIADLGEKLGKAPPKTSNRLTLKKWIDELGFTPTREDMIEGRRVYDQRIRTREQRNP